MHILGYVNIFLQIVLDIFGGLDILPNGTDNPMRGVDMEIIVIIAQRKDNYPGQYGEECLACMSEYEYSENPDYLQDALAEHRNSGEFEAVELITLKVPDEEITRRLFPARAPIAVEVSE
jgi:hypothetical protein